MYILLSLVGDMYKYTCAKSTINKINKVIFSNEIKCCTNLQFISLLIFVSSLCLSSCKSTGLSLIL